MRKLLFIALLLMPLACWSAWNFRNVAVVAAAKPKAAGGGVPDVTSGLIVWWKFDEGSGTTATDSSGSGNAGTLNGSPSYVTGKVGAYALQFHNDGSSGADNVENSTNFTGDWTISFWAKQLNNEGAIQYAASTAAGTGMALNFGASDWLFYDGSTAGYSGQALSTNVWYFLTLTKAGTTYTYYQNGSPTVTNTLTAVDVGSLTVGARQSGFAGIDGILDDFRLYNRKLSASEVSQLYSHYP